MEKRVGGACSRGVVLEDRHTLLDTDSFPFHDILFPHLGSMHAGDAPSRWPRNGEPTTYFDLRMASAAGLTAVAVITPHVYAAAERFRAWPVRDRRLRRTLAQALVCFFKMGDSVMVGFPGASSAAFLKAILASSCLLSLSKVSPRLNWASASLGSASTAFRK